MSSSGLGSPAAFVLGPAGGVSSLAQSRGLHAIPIFWFAPGPFGICPSEWQGYGCAGGGLASPHARHVFPAPELRMPKSLRPEAPGWRVSLGVLGAGPCAERVGGVRGPIPAWDRSVQFGFDAEQAARRELLAALVVLQCWCKAQALARYLWAGSRCGSSKLLLVVLAVLMAPLSLSFWPPG